jgi:hypothetical protein
VVRSEGLGELAAQRLLGELRPTVGVRRRDGDPFLEGPPALAGVEERGPLQRERLLALARVGELERHHILPEAGDELAVPLQRGHAHHLRLLDVAVAGEDVVDDLLEAFFRIHRPNYVTRAGATPFHHPLSSVALKSTRMVRELH